MEASTSANIKNVSSSDVCQFQKREIDEDVATELRAALEVPSASTGVDHGRNVPMGYRDIVTRISCDRWTCIMWMFSMGLLAFPRKCPVCETRMRIVRERNADGVIWRCSKQREGERHYRKTSLRAGSWFENSRLSLETIMELTFMWVKRLPPRFIREELHLSKVTQLEWFSFCHEICEVYLQELSHPIGGPGTIVELEESKFVKRKYHHGRHVEGQWVFGGVQRNSTEMFLLPVEERGKDTLTYLVTKWIKPGTTIVTDCQHSYSMLSQMGFTHFTVNHSKKVINPNKDAHKKHCSSYLAEYMWRLKVQDVHDTFLEFLNAIRHVYPVDEEETLCGNENRSQIE